MKIQVLGSGGVSSTYRSPAYILDGKILVDVPNGSWKLLKSLGYEWSDIEDVIITHFHADHYFDLPFIFISRFNKEKNILRLFASSEAHNKVVAINEIAYPDVAKKILSGVDCKINDSLEFTVGPYKAKKYKVVHGDFPEAYAFTLDDGKTKIGFSGDSSNCPALEEAVKGCKHFFCECSLPVGNEKHMGVSDFFAFANKYKDCTFYATHMTDMAREILEQEHPENVVVLKDLDIFEI